LLKGENLRRALKRGPKNEGSLGGDGLTVEELPVKLREHWTTVRKPLLTRRYRPSAVKRWRFRSRAARCGTLGIPTGLDRFVQRAVVQVLQPMIDSTF
jgi:retron-type reverse transcriptase